MQVPLLLPLHHIIVMLKGVIPMMNEALLGIYIISFPMTLILLRIWKTKLHHPLFGIESLYFSLSTFISLLLLSENGSSSSVMRCA